MEMHFLTTCRETHFESLFAPRASDLGMKRLDRLDSLRIVTPCDVPWSSMRGDDAVRFCGKCSKNVYNVAALSRAEALDLVERAEGRVCMQLSWRRDGTLATGDCWARLRRARRRGILAFVCALPIALAAQLWSQAFGLRALYGVFNPPRVMRGEPLPSPPPPPMAGGIAPLDEAEPMMLGEIAPEPPEPPPATTLGRVGHPVRR
jgi:hypothetical protein